MKKLLSRTILFTMMLTGILRFTVGAEEASNMIEKTYDYVDFENIYAEDAFKVNITQGSQYSVIVTANDFLEERLDVRLEGDTLKLGLLDGVTSEENVEEIKYEAHIIVPYLKVIEAVGASNVKGLLEVEDLSTILKQASSINLKGYINNIVIDATGASTGQFKNLTTNHADLTAAAASTIEIKVNETVIAKATGTSTIIVHGEARFDKVKKDFTSEVKGKYVDQVKGESLNTNMNHQSHSNNVVAPHFNPVNVPQNHFTPFNFNIGFDF